MARIKSKGIQTIIRELEKRADRGGLCSVGRERLVWWRANGGRFKSPKAACLTWNAREVYNWFADRRRTHKIPQSVRTKATLTPHFPSVSIVFYHVPVETPLIKNLTEALKLAVTAIPTPLPSEEWRKDLAEVDSKLFTYFGR